VSDWTPAPVPFDELERRTRLARLGLQRGGAHAVLDALVAVAARDFAAPIALVSLVDADEQWFPARIGLDVPATGRAESFCGHAIASQAPLVVPDALQDRRFAANPLVAGPPGVRAYLGVPLFSGPAQSGVGTLCVIDRAPRVWSAEQQEHIARLGLLVESQLEAIAYRETWEDAPLALLTVDANLRCLQANPAFGRMLGRPVGAIQGRELGAFVRPADRAVLAAMHAHVRAHRESPTRRELVFTRLGGEAVLGGVSMAPLRAVDGHAVVVIRDISLERRTAARSGVVAAVRAELDVPLARAQARSAEARARGVTAADLDAMDAAIGEFNDLVEARIGDIAARVRVEADLSASEQRVRTLLEQVFGPLLVIDDRGRVVDANGAALGALGWSFDDLVGASLRVVLPAFSEGVCARWVQGVAGRPGEALSDTATFVRRDGADLHAELRVMRMDWNGPDRLVVLVRDVTESLTRESTLRAERDGLVVQHRSDREAIDELHRVEAALKHSLEEKETMLKEIHHRVKNNLQLVSSLLTLQMEQVDLPAVREALGDSVRRVRSMALIHQHLYGSASLERVELGSYAHHLAEALRMTLAPRTRLRADVASVDIPVDKAVPICLLLSELLTNAFKYGLRAPGATGPDEWDVRVGVATDGRTLRVSVSDRGPGLPAGFRIQGHGSLGLQLVSSLTRQVRGEIHARTDGGAVFELLAPL